MDYSSDVLFFTIFDVERYARALVAVNIIT